MKSDLTLQSDLEFFVDFSKKHLLEFFGADLQVRQFKENANFDPYFQYIILFINKANPPAQNQRFDEIQKFRRSLEKISEENDQRLVFYRVWSKLDFQWEEEKL